jgi:cathepsin D
MISLSLVAVALLPFALAAPQPDAGVIHVPIVRRSQTDRVANLPKAMEALRAKYGYQPTNATYSKRANTAAVPITDEVRLSDFLFISPWNNHFASKMIPVTPVLLALGLRKLRC